MKIRLLAGLTALAAAALMIGFAPAAQAAPNASATTSAVRPLDDPYPCWTSFSTKDPQGAKLTIYYNNCGTSPVTVCPIYIGDVNSINSGTNIAYCQTNASVGGAATVANGTTFAWTFPTTFTTGNYSVAVYENGPDYMGEAMYTCWTSYLNEDPYYLYQYYQNCTPGTMLNVCPVYVSDPASLVTSTNIAYCENPETADYGAAAAVWIFDYPFTTGDYTTALWE
jgi:hypothetical protein